MEKVTLVILLTIVGATRSLTGYDCTGPSLNVTTFSLLDVSECETPDLQPTSQELYVQLLQVSEYHPIKIIQCKVRIDRTIYHCGMYSHVSIVHNGRREYIHPLTQYLCEQAQVTGSLSLGPNSLITGLKRNSTHLHSLTISGSVGTDGTCKGSQYSDPYGTWDDVVVQASVEVTLKDYYAAASVKADQIHLQSGTICVYTAETCQDEGGAENFWETLPSDSCGFNEYDVLYEGLATKLTTKGPIKGPVLYTVTSKDVTFALTKTDEFTLCGYTIIRTEHPKLLILETSPGRIFKAKTKTPVENLDIFAYINSKFIYVERHLKTQLTDLYIDITRQKCALERQILKNALSLATLSPDETAYSFMKEPGYMAIIAGEVIHLIKCTPVEVKIRSTENCYKNLPITHRNQSCFLTPKTHIITQEAAMADCNELLPTMYMLHGSWYRITPKLVESVPPPTIQPLTRPEWKYISPEHLATSGIYSSEDLNKLRSHIMEPAEKPAILNTLLRGVSGQHIPKGQISLYNLMDEEALDKIATSTSQRLWGAFVTFGSASAGVIAIFMILRLIKYIADTVIHGYALHSIYGWSVHLVGALWGSLTHLLLHLARTPTEEKAETEQKPPGDAETIELPTAEQKDATNTFPSISRYLQEESTFKMHV